MTHEAKPQEDSSAFQRFAKVMRAPVAVPKRELDEKLARKEGHYLKVEERGKQKQ